MTYVPTVGEPQLIIQGVYDAGSPNFERVLFWASAAMNLSGFGITLGLKNQDGTHPLFDNCYWFPSVAIQKPCWVVVYSRRGTPEWTNDGATPVLHLFWQRDQTMFSKLAPGVIPILFRVNAAAASDLK